MKFRLRPHYFVFLFSLSSLFSCKKDDAPITIVVPEEKPALFEQIQGKWTAKIDYDGRVSSTVFAKPDFSAKVQDMPRLSSVEFFSDSTYILVLNHSRGYTNKFTVKDSSTLYSTELGDISNVKVTGDSISFTFLYHDIPLSVKAAKSAKLNVAGNQKSIVNEWSLIEYEEGPEPGDNWNDVNQYSFIFTNSGTLGIKSILGDNYYLQVMGWKWKPGSEGEIIYYDVSNIGENYTPNDYFKVTALTATTLKLQAVKLENEYDEDENITGTKELIYYTLTFAAK